jgi:acetyl-CoA carboxylase beta subunit
MKRRWRRLIGLQAKCASCGEFFLLAELNRNGMCADCAAKLRIEAEWRWTLMV